MIRTGSLNIQDRFEFKSCTTEDNTRFFAGQRRFTGNYKIRRESEQKWLEEELRKAKEAAKEASKAKSQFLAIMSHELRTPMNAILGMTDVLIDNIKSEENREYLEVILNNGHSLLKIINAILDLSKIETSQISLYRKPTNPCSLLYEMAGLYQSIAAKKDLKFK